MSIITKDEVRYIAKLARVDLTEEEIEHFQGQLECILEYIHKLKKLDVAHVDPMTHVLDLKNIERKDKRRPSLASAKALKIAPSCEGQFYKVPRVIE